MKKKRSHNVVITFLCLLGKHCDKQIKLKKWIDMAFEPKSASLLSYKYLHLLHKTIPGVWVCVI